MPPAWGLGTLEFDFNTPELSITVNPNTRAAKAGERLSVSVSATDTPNEAGLQLYRVVDDGDDVLLQSSLSSSLRWEHVVSNDEEDAFTVRAEMTDAAGNEATTVTGEVLTDGKTPAIETFEIEGPAGTFSSDEVIKLGPNTLFTFRFSVNDVLPQNEMPEVVFDNNQDAPLAMTMQEGNGQWPYVFTATTPPSGQASQYTIIVTLEDEAGNRNVERPLSFSIDHVPPILTGLDVNPASVKPGGIVRVNLVANETLGSAPTLSANFNGNIVLFTTNIPMQTQSAICILQPCHSNILKECMCLEILYWLMRQATASLLTQATFPVILWASL